VQRENTNLSEINLNSSGNQNSQAIQVAIPDNSPRNRNGFLAWLGRWGLRRMGWQVKGQFADVRKLIVIVAPHSSNWDWIIGVCALWGMEMRFSYLIKDAAFIWPLSVLLRRTGGIPIDRSQPDGVVKQITNEFYKADQLYYAITPEGTRKKVKNWKTGFLRLAYQTKVPVIPVSIDYSKKEILIPEPLKLKGDIESDMQMIRTYYNGFKGKKQD